MVSMPLRGALGALFLFAAGAAAAPFQISSRAFDDRGRIPVDFTCDGKDVPPPLQWTDPPTGTQSYVLLVDDPDARAGLWTHWILFDLPDTRRSAFEGVKASGGLLEGAEQGVNSFGESAYSGPCPPPGETHRYQFHLFALDAKLHLGRNAERRDVLAAMSGHVLAATLLSGTCRRLPEGKETGAR